MSIEAQVEQHIVDAIAWKIGLVSQPRAHRVHKNWYALHRDRVKACVANWSPEQRARANTSKKACRYKRRGVDGSHTIEQVQTLGDVCLCCGLSRLELVALNRVLVSDHVIPIAHGGSNDISNIQPLCHGRGGCNNHKGVKHTDYRGSVSVHKV
jgi:5-methylcytosine-specific restriction endonuclease McrA